MRQNTADEWMMNKVAELKGKGVDQFLCCTWTGNRYLRPVWKKTAPAISKYANDMFLKYGEGVSVTVDYYDSKTSDIKNLTYYQA